MLFGQTKTLFCETISYKVTLHYNVIHTYNFVMWNITTNVKVACVKPLHKTVKLSRHNVKLQHCFIKLLGNKNIESIEQGGAENKQKNNNKRPESCFKASKVALNNFNVIDINTH